MNSKTSSKSYFSPFQSSIHSQMTSTTQEHLQSLLRYPFSAGQGSIARVPPCVNHKRKKSAFVYHSQDQEKLYFCQRCMSAASKQGFKGHKLKEFHGTPSTHLFKPFSKEKDKVNRNEVLNQYLQELKRFFQQICTFRESIQSALVSNSNSNYIEALITRLETQLHNLKQEYRREKTLQQNQILKNYQQVLCKVVWHEEDLEHMISRICKHYDKLTKETEDTFQINLELMKESLKEKKITFGTLYEQFGREQKYKEKDLGWTLQDIYRQRIQKIWEECLLNCSISKISISSSGGEDSSVQFGKIVQELSTTQTLA